MKMLRAVIECMIGWPFEMPRNWRRVWMLTFPLSIPIWFAGIVLSLPLVFVYLFGSAAQETWK